MEQDSNNAPPLINDEPLVENPPQQSDDKNQNEKPVEIADEKSLDQEPQADIKDVTDSGIFEFMTPDRAIELYKRIHASGPPDLEWKFYGRRKPDEASSEAVEEDKKDRVETPSNDITQDQTANTEFDFDDETFDLQTDTSIANESLQLKRKSEPGGERRTNLSDIMSDIMKETHLEEEN